MKIIYKYYIEIRNRLTLLSVTWLFSIFSTYVYKEILLFLYINTNITYFIFTDIKEIFSMYIQIIFIISNQIFLFFFIFHILIFISLGLHRFEYKYLKKKTIKVIFFWICSLVLLNNIILPISFNFFLSFKDLILFKSLNLHFEAKLSEYLNFYLSLYYICSFYCQSFIFLTFFFDYINLDIKLIKINRKIFYYFFLFFSTLVTPPDVINQILFSLILILAYELIIFSNLINFFISTNSPTN